MAKSQEDVICLSHSGFKNTLEAAAAVTEYSLCLVIDYDNSSYSLFHCCCHLLIVILLYYLDKSFR